MSGTRREASLAEIRRILSEKLGPQNLRVSRGHAGAVFVRAISPIFEDVEDAEVVIDQILAEHGLRLPANALTTLRAPSELDADERSSFFPEGERFRGTPNWADALLFEPEEKFLDERHFNARVIAFWGVKGGVGRTTGLAHTASILGKGRKVLAFDLDLDSPGLVATLARDVNGERPRFEALVRFAGDSNLSQEELVKRVKPALRPAKSAPRVQVLGPAKADAEFVKDLLGPLAPSAMYRGDRQALRKLFRSAIVAAEADLVLVDARSGYCDESAMAVLDLADEVVMFVSPAPSTFGSLAPAIEALERNRRALGRPRIVHVVAGMLPAGEDTRLRVMEQLQGALDDARRAIAVDLETPYAELPPNIDVLPIFYSGRVVENEGRVLEDTISMYSGLAERILGSTGTSKPLVPDEAVEKIIGEIAAFFSRDWSHVHADSPVVLELRETVLSVSFLQHASPTMSALLGSGVRLFEDRLTRADDVGAILFGDCLDESEARISSAAWLGVQLRDGNGTIEDLVVFTFLKKAFEFRRVAGGPYAFPLLDPPSMRAALPLLATAQLQQQRAKATPEEKSAIAALQGQDADQSREKLTKHLAQTTGDPLAFDRLQKMGFLRVTRRHDGAEMVRIVDLYALAPELEIRRLGRR